VRGAKLRSGTLPLSLRQERLWVLDQVAPDPRAFKTVQAYRVPRALELESLRAAFADVVARHEALRTVVETHGEEPRARVLSRSSWTT
jgi:hypothetical protein